jgi:hypothetical protein
MSEFGRLGALKSPGTWLRGNTLGLVCKQGRVEHLQMALGARKQVLSLRMEYRIDSQRLVQLAPK